MLFAPGERKNQKKTKTTVKEFHERVRRENRGKEKNAKKEEEKQICRNDSKTKYENNKT